MVLGVSTWWRQVWTVKRCVAKLKTGYRYFRLSLVGLLGRQATVGDA